MMRLIVRRSGQCLTRTIKLCCGVSADDCLESRNRRDHDFAFSEAAFAFEHCPGFIDPHLPPMETLQDLIVGKIYRAATLADNPHVRPLPGKIHQGFKTPSAHALR